MRFICEQIRAFWDPPAGEPPGRSGKAAASKGAPALLLRLHVTSDILGNLGLVRGDLCDVYEADDLKPGDAAAVYCREFRGPACRRVVKVTASYIILRDDREEFRIRRAGVKQAGRIDILNQDKSDALTPGQRARADLLQRRLDGMDRDDITNSSAAMKLERELFDLEHPKDVDDWSALEGGADE